MTAKPPKLAVAFSYVRFSSAEQMKGDSLRRQTQSTEEWCKRNGVTLDTTTTLHDLGKSAFTKAKKRPQEDDGMASVMELADLVNPDRRALAGFLELIKRRKVPRGAYLVIENLDRLSRDEVVPATHLLTGILLAGVRVVQLKPIEQVLTERSDGYAVLMAVMELSRGNGESKIKSERIGSAWETKRKHASNGVVMTRNLPAWVRIESMDRDNYVLVLIPERAQVVSRIFALAASGLGSMRIAQKLTEEGVPAFARSLDEKAIARYEERRRQRDLPPLTAKEREVLEQPGHWNWRTGEWVPHSSWSTAYIHDLLTDRRALGEILPRAKRGQADGPPIANYFPTVVDEKTFNAARAALAERRPLGNAPPKEGRRGRDSRIGKHVDLFAKMVFNAMDGSPYYVATKSEALESRQEQRERLQARKEAGLKKSKRPAKRRRTRILINAPSCHGQGPKMSFPMATFEKAILRELQEIDPHEVLGEATPDTEVKNLERQLGWIVERQQKLAAELREGDIPVIAQQLRQMKEEEEEIVGKLDQARQLAAKPLSETWDELFKLLEDNEDKDVKYRLRSALARIIDKIHLVVVPRGRDRLAEVQVEFKGSKAKRTYTIIHRPPLWLGTKGLRRGAWNAFSLRINNPRTYKAGDQLSLFDDGPLSDPVVATRVQKELQELKPEIIEGWLAEGETIAQAD